LLARLSASRWPALHNAQSTAQTGASAHNRNLRGGIMVINVRFFIFDCDLDEPDYRECTESEFLAHEGMIHYERNTVRENGVNQICLSKS
jgi:hypothetical protein